MTDFKNEFGEELIRMANWLFLRDGETYKAWVAQHEKEFPSRDASGNYIPRSFYRHEPSEELNDLRERHLKIHGLLSDVRRLCLDCGMRFKGA